MPPTAWDFHHGDKVLEDTTKIRNICILAHVDHGKTTIADSLVASNGIISNRLAGQLRYMDDREDEQSRGITMKASTVTLLHRCGPDNDSLHAVNLIDSPGHVDFSSEVSTAVRLADGAIIVVDVVEGVSAQTHVVLRQAWQERLQPVLVLNKLDRLILELQLTPAEAYEHLQRILEQVNAITSTLFMHQLLQKDAQADIEPDTGADDDGSSAKVFDFIEAQDDESIYFEPARGNVVFASAIDGWGFSLNQFAQIMAKKLGCETKVKQIQKVLWGDYYLTKEKGQPKIKGKALAKGKVPLFASYVLATVWEVYQAACVDKDKEKISHIGKKVGIKVSMKDLQNVDPKGCIRTLMGQWLPLARATMNMVCECVPSPVCMNEDRVTKFLYSQRPRQHYSKKVHALEEQLKGNHTEGFDVTTAFISKMVAVNIKHLPHEHQAVAVNDEDRHRKRVELLARRVALGKDQGPKVVNDETNDDDVDNEGVDQEGKGGDDDGNDYAGFELSDNHGTSTNVEQEDNASEPEEEKEQHIMIAHTRVFSGILREGQTLHVLGAQYDPEKPTKSVESATIEKIYILMGREFVRVKQAPAGSIVGLEGLGQQVPKTATLSSSLDCPPFCAIDLVGKPIVRVALDTDSINDMPKLKEAMKRLHQADPGVEVLVQSTGELVLVAAGEVHIERCVRDLQTIFCPGLKFNMSKPIVPLRETIVKMSTVDMRNETIDENNVHVVKTQHYLLKGCPENTSSTSDVVVTTGNKHLILAVKAIPLPESVTKYLVEQIDRIRFYHTLFLSSKHHQSTTGTETVEGEESDGEGEVKDLDDNNNNNDIDNDKELSSSKSISLSEEQVKEVTEMREQLASLFAAEGTEWVGMENRILAFGPRHCGPNIIFSKLAGFATNTFFANCGIQDNNETTQEGSDYFNTLVTAFQQQTVAGPLANEPMMGVAFEVTSVTVTEHGSASDSGFYGQLLTTCKNAMKWAFLSQSVRLMTAMYMCEMLVDSSTLGKVYAVLSRRNCKIVNEEMKEGTDSFIVQALVPVTGSFGFSEEIRRKSSGLATPQLIFSHWGIIFGDPFWVPTTEEELEHYGEKADAPNPGMDLLNEVRKRKGLHVEKKIVEFAEKQRTLGKNK
eukprot:m.161255 g.161255  ORF g.161255 m.161255 type:complete len:1124 (+) comp31221_c0_seq2:139-3510(+)